MIPRMNLKTYTVARTALVDPSDGRKVGGTVTTLTIRANVRPASGKALQVLPESRRTDDVQSIYTATELYLVGATSGGSRFDCDVITLFGEPYEILDVSAWPGHYECLAARQVKP